MPPVSQFKLPDMIPPHVRQHTHCRRKRIEIPLVWPVRKDQIALISLHLNTACMYIH